MASEDPSAARNEVIAPTLEQWEAMSLAERERFLIETNDALSESSDAMSEGRPHKLAKVRTLDTLGLYFRSIGRVVYLAEELAVHYPGRAVFTPDILAVLDVPQDEDDTRLAWVVADEGKGPDLVIEVLHAGDRKKDLVTNVERYAQLGIPEYFVYDRARQRLVAHRLPEPGAKRYLPILAQAGRYHSQVLGLDLVIEGTMLKFYAGTSELFGTEALISRLENMVASLEEKNQRAQAEAERAQAEAERATATFIQQTIVSLLGARQLTCTAEQLARIEACLELTLLQRWVLRAATATTAAEVFDE